MTSRRLVWIAAVGNCLVAATTYATYGWNAASGHAAARNTAWFSMCCFLVGFSAPGLARLIRGLPAETALIYSFVAAHMVHFATVALLLATFDSPHVTSHPIRSAAGIFQGFALVVFVGLTARPQASRLNTVIHRVVLYAVFLVFFGALARNSFKPLRAFVILPVLALIIRHSGTLAGIATTDTNSTKSA